MKFSLIILNQNDVLAINHVVRKDANGKKCHGKADQYLQRISILDFLGHLNSKVVLIIFLTYCTIFCCVNCKIYCGKNMKKEHFEEFLPNQN